MAKFIEMVGTAGVGKTTTYNYLLKRQGSRGLALFYEDMDRIGNRILKPDFILRKLGFQTGKTVAIEKDYSLKFAENNRELMDMFWESLFSVSSTTEPDIRFHRANYLKKIIYKIQRIKEDPTFNYYILDEGLIHNFHYFTVEGSEGNLEDQIENLLNHTEPPAGILFFEANPEILLERTLNRKKKLGAEMGLTHGELFKNKQKSVNQWKKCIAVLEGRGIPVLRLNPLETVRVKARSIKDFILHLEKREVKRRILQK